MGVTRSIVSSVPSDASSRSASRRRNATQHSKVSSRINTAAKAAYQRSKEALIPADVSELQLELEGRTVQLTNLHKLFWPALGITKGALLRYYAETSSNLLPHLKNRAMVMKRYPDGARGKFFFQKRTPVPRPDWLDVCSIPHASGNIIEFPIVHDLPSLLWIVNLGCIDLNPWYARCDDTNRPDYLHFDLDPVKGTPFELVCQTALLVHQQLDLLKMPNFAKTSGSRGIHIYVPIVRGPTQKQVWTFAKAFALTIEQSHPQLITSQYRLAKRPKGRVLVDYNQNAWGRTLASVYSVRPTPQATVSTPVTWDEISRGIRTEDFHMNNVWSRVHKFGDLWKPMVEKQGRFELEKLL